MADPHMEGAPENEAQREESRGMAMLSNALAIIGFIILIVIFVWGLLHIASLTSISWGSIFSSKPRVEVVAPKNGTAGQSIPVSWKYTGKEVGTFAFLYTCAKDVQLLTNTPGTTNVVTKIPCGTAINVGSSTAATVIPASAATDTVPVAIKIMFASADGKTHVEGSATIAIAPGSQTPVAKTPDTSKAPSKKPTETTQPPTSYHGAPAVALVPHASSGPADLSVRMITVGVMDPSGALINRRPASPLDIIGVEFDIANVGGSATGVWYFTASVPTGPSNYLYTSPMQISLAPGEHIVNVLRFSPNMLGNAITITVDPSNRVIEASKTNNTVTQTI